MTPARPDPADTMARALTVLLRARDTMPADTTDPAVTSEWVKATLGTSYLEWYPGEATVDEIWNTVQSLPGRITDLPSQIETGLGEAFRPDTYLGPLISDVERIVGSEWSTIESDLQKGLAEITQYAALMGQVNAALKHYERRFGYAMSSLKDLASLTGRDFPALDLLGAIKGFITSPNAGDAETALIALMKMSIVDSNPMFQMAGLVMTPGLGGVWSNIFPCALAPGQLNQWINPDPPASGPPVSAEERDYRKELVAAIDHYCRGRFGGPNGGGALRGADDRLALEVLADLASVVLTTTFAYVVRHPNLPSPVIPTAEWAQRFLKLRADDRGNQFSLTFSRHLGYQVKAVAGLVFRGFWAINTLNAALVEAIASVLGNLFGGLFEAALRDLLWSVEIHEVYPDQKLNAAAWTWDTQETINGDATQHLKYGVFIRANVLEEAERPLLQKLITSFSTLQALLKDYGAYMDSLRDYQPDEVVSVTTDTVSVTDVSRASTTATVKATSSFPAEFPSIPVLRAYCDGQYVVMQKVSSQAKAKGASYVAKLTDLTPGSTLSVRSNYGGVATHTT
jgi:hypothetical protein